MPTLLIIIIIAVVVIAAGVITAILVTGNTEKLDFIKIGKDEVPSVKLILGETRKVISTKVSASNGLTEKTITYSVDENQDRDMYKYAQALMSDYGFINSTDYDFSGPTGKGFEFAKASVQDKYIVIVRIEYDRSGYVITLRRGEGTITIEDGSMGTSGTQTGDSLRGDPSSSVSQAPDVSPVEKTTPSPDDPPAPSTSTPAPVNPPPVNPSPENTPPPNSSAGVFFASRYYKLISSDRYYVKYQSSMTYEDEVFAETIVEMAIDGHNSSMTIETDGVISQTIMLDGVSYGIYPAYKMIYKWTIDPNYADGQGMEMPDPGIVLLGTGNASLMGVTYKYEEYDTLGGIMKVFIDGSEVVGIENSFEGMSTQMRFLDMSADIPARMFDIPSDYEVISVD